MNTFTIIFQDLNQVKTPENQLNLTKEFNTQQLTAFALLNGIKDASLWIKSLTQDKLHLVTVNSSNQIQGIISGIQKGEGGRVIAINTCLFTQEKSSEIEALSEVLKDLIIKFGFNGIKIPNETRVQRELSNNFLFFNDLHLIPSNESNFDFFELKKEYSKPFIA